MVGRREGRVGWSGVSRKFTWGRQEVAKYIAIIKSKMIFYLLKCTEIYGI